jgi:hypothetical protein
MIFTKIATMTWNKMPDAVFTADRIDQLIKMTDELKTDGQVIPISEYTSPFIFSRKFVTLVDAEEWKTWLETNAPAGFLLSVIISDVV